MLFRRRGSTPRPPADGRMTLAEHLGELRSRIIKCLIAVAIAGTVAFVFYPQIIDTLVDPYCDALRDHDIDRACALVVTDPLEGFGVRMKVAAYGGIALAMPVLLWQLWRFVAPGLYPQERRLAIPFVLCSLVLFILGAGIAYWTMPKALDFLIGIGGEDLEPLFSPSKYLGLITLMMLAFGVGFEFPVLLVFLQLVGVLTPQRLASWRRYAWVGIVALVAVVTPSGDPFSLMALTIPMWLFYEVAILIGRLAHRRRPVSG